MTPNRIVYNLAFAADSLRGLVLRRTMRVGPFRRIFQKRWLRLGTWFLLSALVYLPIAIWSPLLLLVAGPVIYGVPHLAASLRYVPRLLESGSAPRLDRPRVLAILGAASVVVIAAKVWMLRPAAAELARSDWSFAPELGLMVLLVAVLGRRLYALPVIQIGVALTALGAFAIALLRYPLPVAGALVLVHNFVGFFYWIAAAKAHRERLVAVGATVLLAAVHVAFFAGAFDGLYQLLPAVMSLDMLNFSFLTVGKEIAPWSFDTTLWFHAVSAFAFGQSLHYFVWLKAIPEQHHEREAPATFSQSARLLESDFGRRATGAIAIICLGSLAIWVMLAFAEARALYFAGAAFHGYLEIAGLFLLAARPFGRRAASAVAPGGHAWARAV